MSSNQESLPQQGRRDLEYFLAIARQSYDVYRQHMAIFKCAVPAFDELSLNEIKAWAIATTEAANIGYLAALDDCIGAKSIEEIIKHRENCYGNRGERTGETSGQKESDR